LSQKVAQRKWHRDCYFFPAGISVSDLGNTNAASAIIPAGRVWLSIGTRPVLFTLNHVGRDPRKEAAGRGRWGFERGTSGGPVSHSAFIATTPSALRCRPRTLPAMRSAGWGSLVGPPFRRPPLSQPDQQIHKFVLRQKPRRHAAVEGCRPQTHLQIARKRSAGPFG
jgi:hypothetical protein